jgi:hypothetical protein
VSIKSLGEFTLAPIIRFAGDRVDRETERHRYWLRSNGDLTKDKPVLPWPKSTALIVVAGEPEERVAVSFDATLKVPNTSWSVEIGGTATFVCPPPDVHRLVTRWMRARGKNPDTTFRQDFIEAVETAAVSCSERVIADADGAAGGGELGRAISKILASTWGLRCDLQFELKGTVTSQRRKDIPVEAAVRLNDYEEDIPVTAVVELLPDTASPFPLRALAALGRADELGALFAEETKAFYSAEVGIDQLSDPLEREAYHRKLEAGIRERAAEFGLRARLLKPVEVPPSIPGDADEIVRVSLPGFQLRGEEPVDISLLVKLRLTRRSALVRAMAARPGVPFNPEFQRIARSILGSMAVGWSPEDLLRDRRAPIENELDASLKDAARRYGYEAVQCTLTTTIDPTPPTNETVTLWKGVVRTAEAGVTADVEAFAELTYRAGVRVGGSTRTLLDPIANTTGKIITEIVGGHKPSDLYRYWAVPFPHGGPPVQDEIKDRVIGLLRTLADEPAVTLKLGGHGEFVQLYETIRRSSVERSGVQLKPDKVPGELTVDFYAPVIGLPEQAWAEMATRRILGKENWDPIAMLTREIPRLLQSAFAAVLKSHEGSRLSKAATTELLTQHITREIREQFAIELRPEIRFHSAPEIVEFYRRLAEEKNAIIDQYFERRREIRAAKAELERERTQLITDGLGRHSEMDVIKDSLSRLNAQLRVYERKTEVLQQEYSDASYYIQLLSTPDEIMGYAQADLNQAGPAYETTIEQRQYVDTLPADKQIAPSARQGEIVGDGDIAGDVDL